MPNAILIGGIPHRIHTDFRCGIEHQILAAAGKLTADRLIDLWYIDRPENPEEAAEGILRFYARSDKERETTEKDTAKDAPIAYDFTEDAGPIFAGFQKEYGINLDETEMHWWRFMALLDGLYTYSFADRVGFRVADLSGLDAKGRKNILKKRAQFAITPEGGSVEDHMQFLQDIIKRGEERG